MSVFSRAYSSRSQFRPQFRPQVRPQVRSVLLSGLAVSALSLQVSALELSEEEKENIEEIIVEGELSRYSATKMDTPIFETARSISIEDQQQLLDKGVLELADAYVYAPGVTGQTYGFATRGDWVKVRGLDVPEYRDSLQALFGNYNNTRSHVYTLEQVEILKGPSSVLYGQGSPGGLVNVVSKRPQDEAYREVVAEYGNFDRKQIATDLTGPLDAEGKFLYRMIALYRDSDTQIDHVKDDALVIAPSITWRPGMSTNITLLGNYQDYDGQAGAQFLPTYGTLLPAPNGEFMDPNVFLGEPEFDRYDTKTKSITLLADHDFNASWGMEATARYTKGEAAYNQAWAAFIGGNRYIDDEGNVMRTFYKNVADSKQFAVDVRLRGEFSTGGLEHNVLVGVDYQDVTTDSDYYYAFAPAGYGINVFNPVYGNVPTDAELGPYFDNPENKNQQVGFSIQDQIRVGNLLVTLGLRGDKVDSDTGAATQEDEELSTSIGLMYQLPGGFSPYASFSESFEPVVGTKFDGSAYAPQKGKQYEVGIKFQPEGTNALITASYFDIRQSNLLTADPDHPGFSVQEGNVDIKGFEFEALGSIGDFTLEGNYSYLDTITTAGFRLPSVPEHQASTWVTYRPQDVLVGFKAGFGVRYMGASWDGADGLKTPSYTLADAMVGYETEQWDLSLNVRNLTNKQYFATCIARGDCFPGKDRTVVARLAVKF